MFNMVIMFWYQKETKMYERMIDETIQCDLCGEKSSEGEIYKSLDQIYLCPACYEKIEAAPRNMKENLERYLLGNVV